MAESIQNQLRKRLEEASDQQFSAFASALIPQLSRPMLGVRLPKLRALAKELADGDWRQVLERGLTTRTFEEVMLQGFIIGYAPMAWDERWQEIRRFVPLIDNWSVCDSCCATYVQIRRHRESAWEDLLTYLHSEEEFQQRFAVVMMMDHYLVEDYLERVLAEWKAVTPHGYYAEMAVGWGVSVAFLHSSELCLSWLRDSRVSLLSRQKACQKILESRRTPDVWRPVVREIRATLVKNKI